MLLKAALQIWTHKKTHGTDANLALSCYKYTKNPKCSFSFHCSQRVSCFKVSYQCKSRFKIIQMIYFCLFWHIWNQCGFPAICIYLTHPSIFAFYSSLQFILDQCHGAAGVYPSTHGVKGRKPPLTARQSIAEHIGCSLTHQGTLTPQSINLKFTSLWEEAARASQRRPV